MKKKYYIALIIFSFIFIIVGCFFHVIESKKNEPYVYPNIPSGIADKANESQEDLLQAFQIPEDILDKLSTRALLETVLNYPLHNEMRLWDNTGAYYEFIKINFNGLSELILRPDIKETIDEYSTKQSIPEFFLLIKNNLEKSQDTLDTTETYSCLIDPLKSEKLLIIDRFIQLEATGGKRYLQLKVKNQEKNVIIEEIYFDTDGYSVLKSSDGRIYPKEYKHCYYTVNPAKQDHIFLVLTDVKGLKYNDIVALLNEKNKNASAWIKPIDSELDGYYNVDGTDNMLDDKTACREAIAAYVKTVERENEKDYGNSILLNFRWSGNVSVDYDKTVLELKNYSGTEIMRKNEITTDYLIKNFVVLKANYYAEYDNLKTYKYSGLYKNSIFMLRNQNTGQWSVWDYEVSH